MSDPLKRALLALVLLSFGTAGAWGQSRGEALEEDEAEHRAARSLELSGREVQRFGFFLAEDREKNLQLHATPVVRHANYNAESYTNVYVWTFRGRPEAIASVTNWYSPRRYYGLAVTSLSTERLIGTRDGTEIWRPRQAGVRWRAIPDAAPPSATAAARLREMRSLARQFRATFKRVATYNESGNLRLMSTPLYRYRSAESEAGEAETGGGETIDGAVFGLAFGTAPQLVLLIEARRVAGSSQWQYAVAPRNSQEFHLWHQERMVWSLPQLAPPWPNSKIPTNTYTVFPDLQREGRTEEFAQQLLSFSRRAAAR